MALEEVAAPTTTSPATPPTTTSADPVPTCSINFARSQRFGGPTSLLRHADLAQERMTPWNFLRPAASAASPPGTCAGAGRGGVPSQGLDVSSMGLQKVSLYGSSPGFGFGPLYHFVCRFPDEISEDFSADSWAALWTISLVQLLISSFYV